MTRQSITAARCRPAPITTKRMPDRVLEAQAVPDEEHDARRSRRCRRRAISQSVVAGNVSTHRPQEHHAAPADRQIEDDRKPVEAAGKSSLIAMPVAAAPQTTAQHQPRRGRVVELGEEGRVGAGDQQVDRRMVEAPQHPLGPRDRPQIVGAARSTAPSAAQRHRRPPPHIPMARCGTRKRRAGSTRPRSASTMPTA